MGRVRTSHLYPRVYINEVRRVFLSGTSILQPHLSSHSVHREDEDFGQASLHQRFRVKVEVMHVFQQIPLLTMRQFVSAREQRIFLQHAVKNQRDNELCNSVPVNVLMSRRAISKLVFIEDLGDEPQTKAHLMDVRGAHLNRSAFGIGASPPFSGKARLGTGICGRSCPRAIAS